MTTDILIQLFPQFLTGFAYNLIISICAMGLGTLVGYYMTRLQLSDFLACRMVGKSMTLLFRNVPSFVLLFYLALIIPTQFTINHYHFQIPPMAKAIFALGAPVSGFACGYFLKMKQEHKVFQLAPWSQYFIIILMASTTASMIGVNEIMATANTSIAQSGNSHMVLPVYSLVAFWFISASLLCSWFIKRVDKAISKPLLFD